MTEVSGKAASPMDAASGDAPQEARLLPDLYARLNALLIECGRQETLIYTGKGDPPNEALPFLVQVARLAEGLCGVMSMDNYDDVIEALEDAI